MSKKGISYDEKRTRLLTLLTEADTFFIYKEIEALVSKRRLFPTQATKEILDSLVDDGLVRTDKVGSQNIFWSLRSEHVAAKLRLKDEITTVKREIELMREKLRISDSDEHKALALELANELAAHREIPRAISKMTKKEFEHNMRLAEEGIDRWIDNQEIVDKRLSRKF